MARFEQVSKVYRGAPWHRPIRALSDVSLEVARGEVLGLVGPNRAGKSTLVRILLSACRPTSGKVWRLGRPASQLHTLQRVGYVHDSQAFPTYYTAWEVLAFYGTLSRMRPAELRLRSGELLERVGLVDRACEPIGRFSKGMHQRLALAQALLNDPELLVLDEPSEGLDLEARRLIRAVVKERREAGHGVLLVSHELPEIGRLCDRIALVRAGELAFCGSRDELLRGRVTERDAQELAEEFEDAETIERECSLESAVAPWYEEAHV